MNNSSSKLNQDSTQLAWQQFVVGNNKALEIVFDKYYHTMLFTAFYYLKNEEQSKDIASEIFMKLLSFSKSQRQRNLAEVNEKLEVFLKVLVKNKCLDLEVI